jgi:hypothetical protein
MALDFPDSPTDGEYYNGFIYDDTSGTWRVNKPTGQGSFNVVAVAGGGSGSYTAGGSGTGGDGGSGIVIVRWRV